MQRLSKIALVIFIVLTISKVIFGIQNIYDPTAKISDPASVKELIILTNQYRAANNLPLLQENVRLTQAALNKAEDMLSQGYFNHTSPAGKRFSTWIKEVNYQYFCVGENLAIDFPNANDAFNGWINSQTHLANIIRPEYREIGIASVSGFYAGRPTTIIVQLFGTRINGQAESSYVPPISAANYHDRDRINQIINSGLIISLIFILLNYRTNKKAITTKPSKTRYQANKLKE